MISTARFASFAKYPLRSFAFQTPVMRYQFSSAGAVAAENFKTFRKEYESNVSAFNEKIAEIEKQSSSKIEKPNTVGYTHPFDSPHHKLNFSPVKTAELFHDFIGPEQVSPHYENFLMSRKYLMAFWFGFFFINIGAATVDLNWVMKSALIPWIYWFQIMYWYLEGRKSMMKPLLVRFYRRAAANECYQFETYYHENIEARLRSLTAIAKEQLEYFDVHSSYQEIKAESINNFLANEYLALQQHITSRAVNILAATEKQEETNRNNYLQKVVDDAIGELDKALDGPNRQEVLDKIMEAAVNGLQAGQCTYDNDPLMPLVQAKIRESVEAVALLSEAEQAKIIALTDSQLKSIKDDDAKAQSDFLTTEPKTLDVGLKANENFNRILSGWGQ